MIAVERRLVAGIGVDGGDMATLDADRVIEHLGDRGQAICGAGGVGDDDVLRGQLVMIDAKNNGLVGILGRGRTEHALGAALDMRHRRRLVVELAGAFHNQINAHRLPGQLRGVAIGDFPDAAETGIEPVLAHFDRAGITAVNAVIGQKVGIGFRRRAVIDCHDLDFAPALLFENRPQCETSDAAKSVDRYPKGHGQSPQYGGRGPGMRPVAQELARIYPPFRPQSTGRMRQNSDTGHLWALAGRAGCVPVQCSTCQTAERGLEMKLYACEKQSRQ